MRSWDPMRNYPELDEIPADEARRLVIETQKKISRQPAMLAGLTATTVATAILFLWLVPVTGLLGSLILGAVVGLSAVAYMTVVIKPRVREELRQMGYPRRMP